MRLAVDAVRATLRLAADARGCARRCRSWSDRWPRLAHKRERARRICSKWPRSSRYAAGAEIFDPGDRSKLSSAANACRAVVARRAPKGRAAVNTVNGVFNSSISSRLRDWSLLGMVTKTLHSYEAIARPSIVLGAEVPREGVSTPPTRGFQTRSTRVTTEVRRRTHNYHELRPTLRDLGFENARDFRPSG